MKDTLVIIFLLAIIAFFTSLAVFCFSFGTLFMAIFFGLYSLFGLIDMFFGEWIFIRR